MKPPPFAYVAASSVDQAVGVLAEYDGEARVIAGGQSLVPLLNFRLARPECLVDINPIASLSYIRDEGDYLAIGAMTREAEVEKSAVVADRCALLAEASRWIGHPAIRHRGTIGGSIAHNDPSAEYPLVAALLDAEVVIDGPEGRRTAAFREFSVAHYTTTIDAAEMVTEVRVPTLGPRAGSAFLEVARRSGDFALVSVAAVLEVDGGTVSSARLALGGVAGTPMRIHAVEDLLVGSAWDPARVAAVVEAASSVIDPPSDFHGSSDYRTDLCRTLVERCLMEAHRNAAG